LKTIKVEKSGGFGIDRNFFFFFDFPHSNAITSCDENEEINSISKPKLNSLLFSRSSSKSGTECGSSRKICLRPCARRKKRKPFEEAGDLGTEEETKACQKKDDRHQRPKHDLPQHRFLLFLTAMKEPVSAGGSFEGEPGQSARVVLDRLEEIITQAELPGRHEGNSLRELEEDHVPALNVCHELILVE